MCRMKKGACLALASAMLCLAVPAAHAQAMGAADAITGGGAPYCPDSGAFALLLQLFGVEYDSSNASERMGLDRDFSEYTREEIEAMYASGELEFLSPDELFWDDANKAMGQFLDFVQEKVETNGEQFKTNMEAVKGWLHDVACGTLDRASDAFLLLKMFITDLCGQATSAEGGYVVDSKGHTGYLQGFSFEAYYNGGEAYPFVLKKAEAPVYVSYKTLGSHDGIVLSCEFVSSGPFTINSGKSQGADYYGETFYTVSANVFYDAGALDGMNFSPVGYGLSWFDLYATVRGATYGDGSLDYPFTVSPSLDGILGRDKSLDNVDVAGTGAIAGATDIPLDLDSLLERVGSIEGMVTAINEGLLTGDDVREIVGALPVDLVDGTTIADDGDREIPVTDIPYAPPVDTTPAEGYTLGLRSLFPFCLPFDLIDFINVLSAPAEAPHFKWPVKYKVGGQWEEYTIDIDLSKFDSAASLLRDMECLAFIVGLVMATRAHMIRG